MSGDYVAANFGAMSQGEQEFMSIYASLTQTLQDLERQLESQLSVWTGQARDAYHQAKQVWNASATHMASVLQQLGAVIGSSNENYQGTEQKLTGLWG